MIIDKSTKLLVLAPHNDDEALQCGGLIGKCLKEKAFVFVQFFCIGESRQLVIKNTSARQRLREIDAMKKFAKVKAEVMFTEDEFNRLDSVPQKDLIEKIENLIDKHKPTIIALPSSSSYNQDHRAVFDAAVAALRPVPRNLRYFTPMILECFEPYYWNLRGLKTPNSYLDLRERYKSGNLLDFKIALYKCHKSQVRSNPFPRSPENLERQARLWGKEIGVEIAEAYHLLRMEIW